MAFGMYMAFQLVVFLFFFCVSLAIDSGYQISRQNSLVRVFMLLLRLLPEDKYSPVTYGGEQSEQKMNIFHVERN